ncbi:MAG: biotin/lipoyl-binding protein [Candidatus Peribacteria bacterium]|nr:MAG: biotin/lipoyl-binding protein [Candidatus Peribacteria bacterium]
MNEQNLSFASEGKITKVTVQIGDQVQAGDVLAELDMDTYYNAIQTAELELAHSELGLEKLLNNDTSLREAQLRSQINETQTSYSIAQEQYTILQQQFQNSLDQKGDQLRQLQHEYKKKKKTTNLASSGLAITNETQVQETESSVNARSQTITTLLSELRGYSDDTKDIITTVDKIF